MQYAVMPVLTRATRGFLYPGGCPQRRTAHGQPAARRPAQPGPRRARMTEMAASLAGKTALVTGAATGIGQAIAAALPGRGAVVVNHNHTPDAAANTVAQIEATGGIAMAIAADVSSRDEYQAMVGPMLAVTGAGTCW